MSTSNVSVRSMSLRAPDGFSISEGLPERRSRLARILAVLRSWLQRLRSPPDVPEHLRADVGLPPLGDPVDWRLVSPGPDLGRALRLDRF